MTKKQFVVLLMSTSALCLSAAMEPEKDGDIWTYTVDSGVVTNEAAITGGVTVVKAGAGTLVLTGANTFTGDIVVEEGTLEGTEAGLNARTTAPYPHGLLEVKPGAAFVMDIPGKMMVAETLKVAGDGPDHTGAVVRKGTGWDAYEMFSNVVLTAATKLRAHSGRFGFARYAIDMGGFDLTLNAGGPGTELAQTRDLHVSNPGNIKLATGRYLMQSGSLIGEIPADKTFQMDNG